MISGFLVCMVLAAAVAATFALCHFATVGVERVVDAAVRDGRGER